MSQKEIVIEFLWDVCPGCKTSLPYGPHTCLLGSLHEVTLYEPTQTINMIGFICDLGKSPVAFGSVYKIDMYEWVSHDHVFVLNLPDRTYDIRKVRDSYAIVINLVDTRDKK